MVLQAASAADNDRFPDVHHARCREADWLDAYRHDLHYFWHCRQLVKCDILTVSSRSESAFNFTVPLSVILPLVLWCCWLGDGKGIRPVKNWVRIAGVVVCLKWGANDLHMVQLMPKPPHHLCFSKIQNGLSFWYWLTQVVLEKRPLKECVCVCAQYLFIGLGPPTNRKFANLAPMNWPPCNCAVYGNNEEYTYTTVYNQRGIFHHQVIEKKKTGLY